MTKIKKDKKFIKLVSSKERSWITHIYYGHEGSRPHGHVSVSGAVLLGQGIIVDNTLVDRNCQEVLYHRDSTGKVLLDTGLF